MARDTLSQWFVDTIVAHPGHANQKVHGRRFGGSGHTRRQAVELQGKTRPTGTHTTRTGNDIGKNSHLSNAVEARIGGQVFKPKRGQRMTVVTATKPGSKTEIAVLDGSGTKMKVRHRAELSLNDSVTTRDVALTKSALKARETLNQTS